ncbi:MAG TPA: SDR family NAD(P)-dependent oxidoreductase [Acidimicrobiia bacterium]|nr:SDR family NAD(P)-dependent oxidoreductase [Acidimicrobiia bacterium]
MRLQGEIALVTGSTSGIGRAIAVEFARQGAVVAVHGRDAERGGAVVDRIATDGGTARFFPADLAGEQACQDLVDAVAAWADGLTVLVNNAVASPDGGNDATIRAMDTAYWEAAMRVNLSAPMWCCRAALPHMSRAGHGSIINISSRQAERPSGGLAGYAVVKSGLNGLTRALAVEEAAQGIRANTISPGYVINERRDADLSPERRARLEAMHLTRLGEASDVAHAAVYLASHESDFLTGINLQLDGGGSNARAASLG